MGHEEGGNAGYYGHYGGQDHDILGEDAQDVPGGGAVDLADGHLLGAPQALVLDEADEAEQGNQQGENGSQRHCIAHFLAVVIGRAHRFFVGDNLDVPAFEGLFQRSAYGRQ